MIKNLKESDSLKFKTLSPEIKQSKQILGRLYGPVASCVIPTRNQRLYSEDLWEKLLSSDLIKEKFEAGGIPGELCHPDREEIEFEKIACIMPEPPVKDKDGNLIAYVDILDTPCGKIAYQLAKYGYKFGISSRGTGDLIESMDGEGSEVDPDTYQLNAFDLVEVPACKNARLSFTESLDSKNSLRESLKKLVDSANEDDRKLMTEALDGFGIKFEEKYSINEAFNTCTSDDEKKYFLMNMLESVKRLASDNAIVIENYNDKSFEVGDKVKCIINNNREGTITKHVGNDVYEVSFQSTDNLPARIDKHYASDLECINPQDCADTRDESVDNAKLDELVAELTESLKKVNLLEQDVVELKEENSVCNAKVSMTEAELQHYKNATINLSDSTKTLKKSVKSLNESITEKNQQITSNKRRIRTLVDSAEKKEKTLKEALSKAKETASKAENLAKELELKSKQLDESNLLVQKYKASYKSLKESYLEAKAKVYGLSKADIMHELKESYKIKDIDRVCESLSTKKEKLNKLPFVLTENTKLEVTPSRNEYIGGHNRKEDNDDYISDSLMRMANM